MDSFELNKIAGAVLFALLVTFGLSIVSDTVFETETPEAPGYVIAVAEVPRTLTGKKLEVPVKKLLLGQPADRVAHRDAMVNPASLDWFVDFARRRNTGATGALEAT